MNPTQRRTLIVLSLIGLVYFCLFLYPNSYGARSLEILLDASGDEYVTYPTLVRILMPGETLNDTRANLFLYEDYHYGYPFYAISALVLLPVRIIHSVDYGAQIQLNLLLLRQFISLLPMILAAGVLVYLQTGFQSMFWSAALFILLLTMRGVVRNHIWWWHPDALALLFVVLTLFFLNRDRLRFGRNFLLAAFFCGMATSIKLLGAFFFLTIAAYLVVGLLRGQIRLGRAVLSGGLFLAVMLGTVVVTNPFLFSDDQRARMIEIQQEKSHELNFGYEHDDPLYYSKGPRWWVSTLEKWYAPPLLLGGLFLALAAGCIWGKRRFANRLILTWVVPYSIYLLYFVAVKPDHYWLPVMLPLFSAAFIPLDLLAQPGRWLARPFGWRKLAQAAVGFVLLVQVVTNLARPVSGNLAVYRTAVERGIVQIQTIR